MKLKKLLLGALGIVTVTAMLAGCGGDKPKDGAKEKVLVVGTEATFPPFEFAKDGSKDIQGFDVDLVNAVAKRIGYKVEWKNMGFDALIPALQSKQIDAIAAGMSVTEERAKAVEFTTPYYETSIYAIHLKGDGIKDAKDLEGKTIDAQIGNTGADLARKVPGATVKELNLVPDVLADIKAGNAQAAFIDRPVAAYYAKLDGGAFDMFPVEDRGEPIAMAFHKENKELVQKVNKALADMKADGEYKKIYEKWFGTEK